MRAIDADALMESIGCADAVKYGNRDRAQQDISYSTMMLYEIRNEIDAQPTVGSWISVKDKLPDERINPLTQDFAEVICFCDFGGEPRRTDVRTYKFGKPTWDKDGHFLHGGQIMDGVITHWQYLPEPPKEENKCNTD